MGSEWSVHLTHLSWCGQRPRRWVPRGKFRYYLLTADWAVVIDGLPFRGQFASEYRRKTWGRSPGDGEVLERHKRPSMKRVKVTERGRVKHLAPLETEVFRDVFPIVEALAALQYDDGTPRQPGYLGVWVQGSGWVVRLIDKDADAQLTVEGKTLDEAFNVLSLILGAEDAPWEPLAKRRRK